MEDTLDQFRETVAGSTRALLLCHDFPDPDCLGAAAGIQFLLKTWKTPSVIAYGGFIGRAENRAMIQYLDIEALPLAGLDLADFDRVIFVDTQPGAGNHSLPQDTRRDVAIDHHPRRPGTEDLPFWDVREEFGATTTLVTQYLRKAKVDISYKLATALFYGLKTDTQDLARETTAIDREVYYYLLTRVDHRLLAQIENPPLERDFFRTISKAFHNLEIIDTRMGWCYLGRILRPDIVAEMADMFVRINNMEWMMCLGYLKNVLYFSIRTKDLKAEAGDIARYIVTDEKGSAGGHGQIAAGRLDYQTQPPQLLDRLKSRYLEILAPKAEPATTVTPAQ